MGDGIKFRSLTAKMMLVLCLALACGVVAFGVGCVVGDALVEKLLLSDDAVTARLTREIVSFRSFVANEEVASTNVNAIGRWNQDHRFTKLTIYGLSTTVTSDYRGAELVGNEYGLVIQGENLAQSVVLFPVNFKDGVYSVSVYDTSDQLYEIAVVLAALTLAVLVFLAMLLIYDQHITRTVQTLSRQVRQVSRGDLERKIQPMTHDEIGQLAMDVDAMRLSIIDKLQREEAAWQANAQLITAVSHDVRTPLTAMMGYLELLGDESLTPEEQQAYLQICKNNAQRLKGLTDELFGFFLVFGKPVPDQSPEEFDAATLIDQILMEHELNLMQREFQVEMERTGDVAGTLYVDLTHLRRVFDNLFSNVNKYADPAKPVTIVQEAGGGDLSVRITNHIAQQTQRAESNRIGLQTCHKLVAAMGGEFHQSRTRDTFTAEVILPLREKT